MKNNEQAAMVVPGEKSRVLHERRMKAVPRGPYNITQIYAEKAKGAILVDVDGHEFIDFAGGIGIQNVGHCHPKVVDAITKHAEKLIHSCFHVAPYESYIDLAERLNELTPGDFPKKTMFANSGAEAVENAIKIARKFTKKQGVISFQRAFHGRTLMTMSLTSKVNPVKAGFGPFAGGTYKMSYPYYYRAEEVTERELDDAILRNFKDFFLLEVPADDIAAVIMEPVQGEGGFIVPSKYFVQQVKQICEENNILLIADEIQTGFCRTGKLFAMEHFEVAPDIITMSKSLAAGMPLSAVTGRAEVMDAPSEGQIGGTLGGNPLSCVASLAVLDIIEEENLVSRAQELGEFFLNRLKALQEKYEVIGEVRGLGYMFALELVQDRQTKEPARELTGELIKYCWQNGLIILSAGVYSNVLRFLPPVIIETEQLEKGITILEKAFEAVVNKKS